MRVPSMTARLILTITVSVAIFWALAVALSVVIMHDEFGEIFDSAMQETAARLAPLVVDDLERQPEREEAINLHPLVGFTGDGYLTYQVRDADGRVVMHSHDVSTVPFDVPLKDGFAVSEHYRFYTVSADSGALFIHVADSLDHRREALFQGAQALLLPAVLLVPVSIAIVWIVVRKTLSPVDQLRGAIAAKDSGNLEAIEIADLPRELRPIARSVNNLLRRLRSAFDAEREFASNSAHELRTPLAGALAQVQLLIRALDDPSLRSRAVQVETSLTRLTALTEKLLQLSRAEAGIGAAAQAVDLVEVLDSVVEDFHRSDQHDAFISYRCAPGTRLMRPVDPDAFAIVMRNLIENAISHGESATPVSVSVEGEAIRVSNGTSAMTQAELDGLRRRFVRGKRAGPGSGLGLSIVDRLLGTMGARLALACDPMAPPDADAASREAAIFIATLSFAPVHDEPRPAARSPSRAEREDQGLSGA